MPHTAKLADIWSAANDDLATSSIACIDHDTGPMFVIPNLDRIDDIERGELEIPADMIMAGEVY